MAMNKKINEAKIENYKKVFGKNIKLRRLCLGITQTELANALGISKGFLSEIESGKTTVAIGKAADIADQLECSLDYLLDRVQHSDLDILRNINNKYIVEYKNLLEKSQAIDSNNKKINEEKDNLKKLYKINNKILKTEVKSLERTNDMLINENNILKDRIGRIENELYNLKNTSKSYVEQCEDDRIKNHITIYKEVLLCKRKAFPKNYWNDIDAKKTSKELTLYLFNVILKWSTEDIKEKLDRHILKEYKLAGMFNVVFKNSIHALLDNAYPCEFKRWEIKRSTVGNDYWNEETGKEAVKWLIEKQLKWDVEKVKTNIDSQLFVKYGLAGMLVALYDNSVYKALNSVYPNVYKEWELKSTPKNYWTYDTGICATKWMIETKLKWDTEKIRNDLKYKHFKMYGLKGMIEKLYNGSVFKAIDQAYPNTYSVNDFKH